MYANRRVCVFQTGPARSTSYLPGSIWAAQIRVSEVLKKTKKEKDLKLRGEGYRAVEVKLVGMGSNMITIHSRHV